MEVALKDVYMGAHPFAKRKRCSRCKEIKSVSEFYKDRTEKDGYQWLCKKCRNNATYEYRLRHYAVGLCYRCSNPALKGYISCAKCIEQDRRTSRYWMMTHKEYIKNRQKIRYKSRKDNHLCVDCGVPLTIDDGVYCMNCNFISHEGRKRGYETYYTPFAERP